MNEKFCEVFEQGYEIIKCYYHNLLKNVSKSAEKSNKMNDEQRKQFIDGVNQIDKTMNQTNCNQDKDTLLSYKRSIEKKVNELLEINGVRGDPELRQIQNLKFEMSIPSYYENLYTLGMVKHGKKPDDKVTCQFIGSC